MKPLLQRIMTLIYRVTRPVWSRVIRNTHRSQIILISEDRVLLIKPWLGDGLWRFPGGGVKESETLEEGAVREAREELGIILSPKELVNLGRVEIGDRDIKYQVELFAEAVSTTELKTRFWEISEAKWFPISKLPTDRKPIVELGLQQWRSL